MKKKKMFLFVVILLILGGATVFALWKLNRSVCEAEGRALNDEMFQKYEDAFKKLNEAYTQLDMNFASAEIRSAVAPYLLLAAEYRIRQAGSRTERVIVLNQLIETEEALRKIMDRPWEGMGSMEPMRRNAEAASLIVGQARAWFLGVPNPDDPAVGSAADEEETEENETDMEDFDAEEMDADETAPEELDPEKPEESVEHPLCWDCKCWFERFGNYLLFFFTESFLVDRVRGLVVQGGMKPFSVVSIPPRASH